MNLGYARTSTVEQAAGLEAQERDLKGAGVDRIFAEQTSSIGARAQLNAALDYLRTGDVLTVTKLDRLARSVADLCAIVGQDRSQRRKPPYPRHEPRYGDADRQAHAQRDRQRRPVRKGDDAREAA